MSLSTDLAGPVGDTETEPPRRFGAGSLLPRWFREAAADALEPTIYRFILRYSWRDQIYLVAVTLLSFPFLYWSLDLPKQIVNDAIGGKHAQPQHEILGYQFGQIPYLVLLCLLFLFLVLINGAFKYHLNVRKGRVGERMLRRLRYALFQRVLRFPTNHFDRTATGQIIAMLTAELEPVGGFIGDSLALPIAQAGTLLTIFIFMFVQNPVLGLAAVALYPIQGYFIPKMQRKIRALGRERVRKMRVFSDRIGETIAAQVEIRTNGGAQHQLADIAQRLGEIYNIRFEVYNRKFFVKFLNNLLNQLTPFFFYLIGGILVIYGDLSFGALVAVLAAYKDLSSPWKELLDFYQNQQDVAIKYEQVVEQFQVSDLLDTRLLLDSPDQAPPQDGDIEFNNVSLTDSDGIRLLDGVNFTLPLGQHAALAGPTNSGKNVILELLARIYVPTAGRISIGAVDLNTLPLTASGRIVGYVGPNTHLLSVSIRDNLLLGLRYQPNGLRDGDDVANREAVNEARKSGNSDLDITADWVDYGQAGVADAAGLDKRIGEVLRLVAFDRDVYLFGLHGRLDQERHVCAAERFLDARRHLDDRLQRDGLTGFVERFDPARYNENASIADNLLFGTPIGHTFEGDALAAHPYVRRILDETELTAELLRIGGQLAQLLVELFGDLAPEHGFAEEFGSLGNDELRALGRVQSRLQRGGSAALDREDTLRLLGLALKLVAARDRVGLMTDDLRRRIVEARQRFEQELPDDLHAAVEFFDPDKYNAAARVEQNILFGTIVAREADARERVEAAICEVLDELDLRDTVIAIGLDYMVGTGGSRLSPAQRQKVAIARAVLKRPLALALDEATSVLDPAAEHQLLEALRQEFQGRSVLAALSRPEASRGFDRVLVTEQGRLASDSGYDEAVRADGPLAPLLAAA